MGRIENLAEDIVIRRFYAWEENKSNGSMWVAQITLYPPGKKQPFLSVSNYIV